MAMAHSNPNYVLVHCIMIRAFKVSNLRYEIESANENGIHHHYFLPECMVSSHEYLSNETMPVFHKRYDVLALNTCNLVCS